MPPRPTQYNAGTRCAKRNQHTRQKLQRQEGNSCSKSIRITLRMNVIAADYFSTIVELLFPALKIIAQVL